MWGEGEGALGLGFTRVAVTNPLSENAAGSLAASAASTAGELASKMADGSMMRYAGVYMNKPVIKRKVGIAK